MKKQRWEESKRREEQKKEDQKRERVRRQKMQVREQVGKSRNTVFFQWFAASWPDERWKISRRCGAKHISKPKCTPHYIQELWVRWPLQPLQPLQKAQLQSPFGPSVDSLCHPCITTTHLSHSVLSLKLPPRPCAVLLVYIYTYGYGSKPCTPG